MPELESLIFTALAAFTIGSAAVVAFSRRIVYSAFALLGTFAGGVGFFILLGADFVAVTQLLVYVGGILVLILFAVMLTTKIGDVQITNQSINRKVALPVVGGVVVLLISILTGATWYGLETAAEPESTVVAIGNALLLEYLLPFEVISVALLGALVGALVIVRGQVRS